MRATIQITEDRGIFSKSWKVVCSVEFTTDELAIIEHFDLADVIVFSEGEAPNEKRVRFVDIIKARGISFTFFNVLSAKERRDYIEHSLLPSMKGRLLAAESISHGPWTIEL